MSHIHFFQPYLTKLRCPKIFVFSVYWHSITIPLFCLNIYLVESDLVFNDRCICNSLHISSEMHPTPQRHKNGQPYSLPYHMLPQLLRCYYILWIVGWHYFRNAIIGDFLIFQAFLFVNTVQPFKDSFVFR